MKTFEAKIMLGLREGYTLRVRHIDEARALCHEFCDSERLCVTLTETTFLYPETQERRHDPGVIIGLIQDPRNPKFEFEIKEIATTLAEILKKEFKQNWVSIVFTDETVTV